MKKVKWIQALLTACAAVTLVGFAACEEEGEESFYDPIIGDYVSIAVEEANLDKTPGTVVALNEDSLGFTVTEGATVTYTVEKTVGAGSAKETLDVSAGTFTVEEGCFYDIKIEATLGEGQTAEFVQVRDPALQLFSFESSAEIIPIIGSGVVQWQKMTEDGNSMMKMYRPTTSGWTQGLAYVKLNSLLISAGLPFGETGETYKIYADFSYGNEPPTQEYYGAIAYNAPGQPGIFFSGRYYLGETVWDGEAGEIETNLWVRTYESEYAIDGTRNYMTVDNIVLVPIVEDTGIAKNRAISVDAGDTVTLDADTFGVTVPAGGSVSYEVTKTLAVGTEKQTLTVTDNAFTAEEGYFYDIKITVTEAGGKASYGYSQVSVDGYELFSFESKDEKVPTIGSGVVQWEKIVAGGNGYMKVSRPSVGSGGAPVVITDLVNKAGLGGDDTVTFDVYADISYEKPVTERNDHAISFLGSYGVNDGSCVVENGRYYLGRAKFESNRMQVQVWITTRADNEYAINGEDNFAIFDNLVLVPIYPEPVIPPLVGNTSITEAVGTAVELDEEYLGITAEEGATVTYTVEKVLGVGTTRETLTGNTFTVEEGYFYNVTVTAEGAEETKYGYAQIRAEGLNLFSFEAENEAIPTIGSGVVQWEKLEENGNTVMKFTRQMVGVGGAPLELTKIFTAGELEGGEGAIYDVYADFGYDKALGSDSDYSISFLPDYNANGAVTANGRYYIGQAKWESNYMRTQIYITIRDGNAYCINGTDNFAWLDNLVLVQVAAPIKVTTFLTEKTMRKEAGTTVALNEQTFGFEAPEGATVTYAVTKTLGAGTTSEQLTLVGEQFTVEAGYFYTVKITMEKADGEMLADTATVIESALKVSTFDAEAEKIPYIGSKVYDWVKESVNGDATVKAFLSPTYATNGNTLNVPMNLTDLITAGGYSTETTATYEVYADVDMLKFDSSVYLLVKGTNEKITQSGRYCLGTASWNGSRFQVTFDIKSPAGTEFALDGTSNFLAFDNFVFVQNTAQ